MSQLEYPQDIKEEPSHEEVQTCNLCPCSTESIFLMKNQVKFHLPIEMFSCEKSAPEGYKCKYCNFHTNLLVFLKKHIQQFHLTRNEDEGESQIVENTLQNLICRSCTFMTYSSLQWLKHQQTGCLSTEETQHTSKGIDLFHCDKCSFKTKYKSNVQRHKLRHLASEESHCDKCPYEATTCSHIALPDSELFHCGQCSFKTKYKRNIQKHNMRKHLASEEFQCDKCPYEGTARVTCPHVALRHSDLFHCNKCSFKTTSIAGLKSHNVRKHTQCSSEEIQWFQCDKCSHKSNKRSNLKTHIIRHHLTSEEIEWLQCDKCPYKTKTRGTLRTHTKRQHGGLTSSYFFQCDKCSYKTINSTNLKRHNIRVHLASEEIQWFQCEKCPHKSKLQIDLAGHIHRKHELTTLTDLFHCDKCTFKTKYKRNLRYHNIRLHLAAEEIDWIQCDKCPYKAKTQNNLSYHKFKNHHK